MGEGRAKILLVDDDREFVAANKLLLEQAGYEVKVAYDGAGGFERARAEKADLVIMDIIMGSPEDGFELCRRIRADETLKASRLLVLTAVGQQFQMAFEPDGMWLPADRVLEKPIDPDALLREVEEILGPAQSRGAAD
ncbi:MAG: response regulator [Planctomycetota bacterium]|jgi:DNA-binding response OmpR family regulator